MLFTKYVNQRALIVTILFKYLKAPLHSVGLNAIIQVNSTGSDVSYEMFGNLEVGHINAINK